MTMRELAELYKALADETRLSILVLLRNHGELCVCDVMGALDITQSKASRHLRYLRHAGLVSDRREGLWNHYRLRPDLDDPRRALLVSLDLSLPGKEVEALEVAYHNWQAQKGTTTRGCSDDEYLKDEAPRKSPLGQRSSS